MTRKKSASRITLRDIEQLDPKGEAVEQHPKILRLVNSTRTYKQAMKVLKALDKMFRTFGIKDMTTDPDDEWGVYGDSGYMYLDTGGLYNVTLAWSNEDDEFIITTESDLRRMAKRAKNTGTVPQQRFDQVRESQEALVRKAYRKSKRANISGFFAYVEDSDGFMRQFYGPVSASQAKRMSRVFDKRYLDEEGMEVAGTGKLEDLAGYSLNSRWFSKLPREQKSQALAEALEVRDRLLENRRIARVQSRDKRAYLVRLARNNPKYRAEIVDMLRTAKDLPKSVEKYVKQIKKKSPQYDEAKTWATAWSIYCVAGSTECITENGILSIREIFQQAVGVKIQHGEVEIRRVASNIGGLQNSKASHVFYTGIKPVVNLTTKHGYRITVTPDHKVACLSEETLEIEWIPASECEGRIAILPSPNLWGRDLDLPDFSFTKKAHNNIVPLRTPKVMTHDLARIIGYLTAEGSYTDESYEFSNLDPLLLEDFARAVEKVFGFTPKVEECKVRLRIRWFREFFQSLGMAPGNAVDKEIPQCILRAPKEYVATFLKAYAEGDGYLGDSDHANRIDFGSVSEKLIRQIQLVLMNMGIPSTFQETEKEGNNVYVCRIHSYDLARKYRDTVGTIYKEVYLKEGKLRGSEFTMLPASIAKRAKVESYFPNAKRISKERIRKKWGLFERARRGDERFVGQIEKWMQSDTYFDLVKLVEPAGEEEVFDITVPGPSSFSANGILVHNCKYKNPDSPRCKKDQSEYFPGRNAGRHNTQSKSADSDGSYMSRWADYGEGKTKDKFAKVAEMAPYVWPVPNGWGRIRQRMKICRVGDYVLYKGSPHRIMAKEQDGWHLMDYNSGQVSKAHPYGDEKSDFGGAIRRMNL